MRELASSRQSRVVAQLNASEELSEIRGWTERKPTEVEGPIYPQSHHKLSSVVKQGAVVFDMDAWRQAFN